MPKSTTLRFFLGANSAQGFVSRFDQLGDPTKGWRTTIIKGGPGTGKSSAMKKLAAAMSSRCSYIEEIYCSSDVESLDGVVLPNERLSIADGTPPHTLEAQYPGAYESVWSLCDCWDEDRLYQNREQIIGLCTSIGRMHKTAASYLYAAGSLQGQLQAIADAATDHKKVQRLAASIAARELRRTGRVGSEKVRFVSGITNIGPVLFEETIATLAPHLYIIDDSWGAASSLLLATLRQHALDAGYEVLTCACPLFPFTKIDHLLLPELGLGFVTRNKLHPLSLTAAHTIHARRFTDMEKLRQSKHRMSFLTKAASGMLEQASSLIGDAKRMHDELETYYVAAMDFAKVGQKTDALIARFKEMCQ